MILTSRFIFLFFLFFFINRGLGRLVYLERRSPPAFKLNLSRTKHTSAGPTRRLSALGERGGPELNNARLLLPRAPPHIEFLYFPRGRRSRLSSVVCGGTDSAHPTCSCICKCTCGCVEDSQGVRMDPGVLWVPANRGAPIWERETGRREREPGSESRTCEGKR